MEAYQRLFPMVPTRGSITCRAILDRQIIHVRDMATAPGVSAAVRNLGHKSQILLPLLRDGAAIGAMSMTSGEIGGFTDSQVALLQTFAEQAVIAITSAETYRELQQRTGDLQESLEYQTATSDVLKVISRSTSDVQPVLDTVVETAARLCGADAANDRNTRGRGLPLCVEFDQCSGARVLGDHAPANSCPRSRQRRRRGWRSKAGSCISRTSALTRTTRARGCGGRATHPCLGCRCCATASRSASSCLPGSGSSRSPSGRSNWSAPLPTRRSSRSRTRGCSANCRPRTRDLEESLEYQTATSDVLKVISRSTSDVQPVLDTVVETAARLCGSRWRQRSHYARARSTACVVGRCSGARVLGDLRQRTIVPGRDSRRRAGGARRQGRACRGHPRRPGLRVARGCGVRATHHAWRAAAARGERARHDCDLSRKRVEPYTERQIELVRTFADQAVIAIENARLLGELQQRTDELAARNNEFGERIEHQSATIDVLKVMSASPGDPQPVFDLIVRRARDLCNATSGWLVRIRW